MSIVTLDLVREQLNDPDDADDDELQHYVDGITAVVEREKREIIEQRQVSRRLRLFGDWSFTFGTVRPLVSLDSLERVDGTVTYDVADLSMDLATGVIDVLRGPLPCGLCIVTVTAGYAEGEVPENYVRGALVIIQHVWETQRGVVGEDAGTVGAEEIRRALSTFTIPAKAREWLGEAAPVVA